MPVEARSAVEGVQSGLGGMLRAAGAVLNGPGRWPVVGLGGMPAWVPDWGDGASCEKRPDGVPPRIDRAWERWPELRKNRAAKRPSAKAPPAKMVGLRRAYDSTSESSSLASR